MHQTHEASFPEIKARIQRATDIQTSNHLVLHAAAHGEHARSLGHGPGPFFVITHESKNVVDGHAAHIINLAIRAEAALKKARRRALAGEKDGPLVLDQDDEVEEVTLAGDHIHTDAHEQAQEIE